MAGHGWVRPCPSGARARCGGPPTCAVCREEARQLGNATWADGGFQSGVRRTYLGRETVDHLPSDSKARKGLPVATGVIDYFPDALVAISELSRIGNDKYNPGEPLHWAREKGGNNSDELMRHFIDRGKIDPDDNVRHSAKVAWRALAILQLEIEAARAIICDQELST